MTISQEVRLNQSSWKIPPVVHAVQNDSGRSLKMIIEDKKIPYGSTATLSVWRADDTHYDISGATLSTSDNSFTADITQALTCPGETKCQLKVSGIVSTYTFIIDVQHDTSGVVSPQEGISLVEAVEAAEDAADRAEEAAEAFEVDDTLSISGKAADAAAVGVAIGSLEDLETEDNTDIVSAINWLVENGGGGTPVNIYTITNTLTNVATSNSAASIRENRSYSAILSVSSGATLKSIEITMGGVDITEMAWNLSTMSINIASVTGNIVIKAFASISVTQDITWTGTTDMSSQIIDATTLDVYYEVTYNDGDSRFVSGVTAESQVSKLRDVALYSDAEGTNLVGYYQIDTKTIVQSNRTAFNSPSLYYDTKVLIAPAGYYIKMMITRANPSFDTNSLFNSYIREYGAVVTLESPEPEEEETTSNAYATDNDLLQVYRSVPLDTSTVADSSTYEGVIEEAKNAWMHEYSGSIDKIPLIIHTDQHDEMGDSASQAMWETIDNIVSWYDISKVINLGDTTNSYNNFDDPTLGDANLEEYLESTKDIPFSKRIEVFGNHDCMKIINGSLTYIPTFPSYLNPYFKNVMARRTSNNGYHVTYDSYFNVKYIVYSTYDYVDASHYNLISFDQYDFLIEEMSKDDGYDIIICGHQDSNVYQEHLGTLVNARYNKTSGSFTDRLGVSHTYDFTDCETDLLVGLHGHNHSDGYNYTNDVLSQGFANYYDSTRPIYFVIIDRGNKQLKVWKVVNTPEYTTYTRSLTETT